MSGSWVYEFKTSDLTNIFTYSSRKLIRVKIDYNVGNNISTIFSLTFWLCIWLCLDWKYSWLPAHQYLFLESESYWSASVHTLTKLVTCPQFCAMYLNALLLLLKWVCLFRLWNSGSSLSLTDVRLLNTWLRLFKCCKAKRPASFTDFVTIFLSMYYGNQRAFCIQKPLGDTKCGSIGLWKERYVWECEVSWTGRIPEECWPVTMHGVVVCVKLPVRQALMYDCETGSKWVPRERVPHARKVSCSMLLCPSLEPDTSSASTCSRRLSRYCNVHWKLSRILIVFINKYKTTSDLKILRFISILRR